MMREFFDLLRGMLGLWWRFLPAIGLWCALGHLLRELCTTASVILGADHRIAANILLVVGLLIWVTTLVVMLQALRPGTGDLDDLLDAMDLDVDANSHGSRTDELVHSVVPFLVVHAVWGLGEAEATRAAQANLATRGGEIDNWSVSLTFWQLYLAMAVIGWVVTLVMDRVNDRHDTLAGTLVLFVGRGTLVLGSFLAVRYLGGVALVWIQDRVAWYWLMDVWDGFVGLLPHWQLPTGDLLPDAVNSFMKAVGGVIVPTTLDVVLLPLVWVSMVAAIRGSELSEAIAENEREAALRARMDSVRRTRAVQRVGRATAAGPLGLAVGFLRNNLSDLAPALHAFRLIIRSGPHFVGAYLVLAALTTQLSTVIEHVGNWLVEAQTLQDSLLWDPLISFAASFLSTTLAMALYSHAYDATIENARKDSQRLAARPRRAMSPAEELAWVPPVSG